MKPSRLTRCFSFLLLLAFILPAVLTACQPAQPADDTGTQNGSVAPAPETDAADGAPDTADTASGTASPGDGETDTPETDSGDILDTDPAETSAGQEPETQPALDLPEPEQLGLANVALFCPVITNSCKGADNQCLTDGDRQTRYTSDSESADFDYEIVIDLTRTYPVSRVDIVFGAGNKTAFDKLTLSVSTDGRTYSVEATQADANGSDDGSGLSVALPNPSPARYVKLTVETGSRAPLSFTELEVLSDIDSYDNILPKKRALSMRPGLTQAMETVYRIPGETGALAWYSENPGIATVDETTGLVTAVSDGETRLFVTDGKNCTAVPITVQSPAPAYVISTFYLANHAPNTPETFDYLREAGITYIENCRPIDMYGNFDAEYLRVLAADYGLTLSVADMVAEDTWPQKSDAEIAAIVEKYRNLPGIGGIYLRDEPLKANTYARVYRQIVKTAPDFKPHLNLLPSGVSDYDGYISDWAATVGSDSLVCLSYDLYPFGTPAGSFNTLAFDRLNRFRIQGLRYGVNTGYYMQAMAIENAYRAPKDNELMYYASLGVAYGMKEFKWFVWFTPPYYGSGEHFTAAVIDAEYKKGSMFEGVKATDRMLLSLSPYLADTDAIEVFHSDGKDGTPLPADFPVTANIKRGGYIVSVLQDRSCGDQYLVFVNKNFAKNTDITLTFNDKNLDTARLLVIENGKAVPFTVDGMTATFRVGAGEPLVIVLPKGYKAYATPVNDGTVESLVRDIGADVSSSEGGPHYAYMLNDGDRTSTSWVSVNDACPTVTFDLRGTFGFNRVDVYPGDIGTNFPEALSVLVSDDRENWRTVASADGIDPLTWGSLTFDTVSARYIRIVTDKNGAFGLTEYGEIEVYMDNGQVPKMETAGQTELKPDENGNLLRGVKPYVSSSYEEYGFTQDQLTDGRVGFVNGVHQGWCSMIGSKTPDITEWVMFALGSPVDISKMIVYPCYDDEFVSDYHLEVSTDGRNWTTVWAVAGDDIHSGAPRILSFDTVTASYVRLVITKMGIGNPNSAVGYKVQIGEIELYH